MQSRCHISGGKRKELRWKSEDSRVQENCLPGSLPAVLASANWQVLWIKSYLGASWRSSWPCPAAFLYQATHVLTSLQPSFPLRVAYHKEPWLTNFSFSFGYIVNGVIPSVFQLVTTLCCGQCLWEILKEVVKIINQENTNSNHNEILVHQEAEKNSKNTKYCLVCRESREHDLVQVVSSQLCDPQHSCDTEISALRK